MDSPKILESNKLINCGYVSILTFQRNHIIQDTAAQNHYHTKIKVQTIKYKITKYKTFLVKAAYKITCLNNLKIL